QGFESFQRIGKRATVLVTVFFEGRAQFWAQNVLRAHQVDADVEMASSQDRPADLRVGGLVGPHGIENDVDRHALGASDVSLAGSLTAECKGDVSHCHWLGGYWSP